VVRLVHHPLEFTLLLGGLALLVVVLLSRTRWRPAAPLRLARRRAWGQILAAAARMYAARPLLFSRAPLLRSTRPRLPLTPFVASSDAAEASLDWTEAEEADEAVPEEEPVPAASGGDAGYASEPPEEAKIYVGNLPYDVDSEALAQLFDQAGVVEVAEVSLPRATQNN
jgi:hypothetical protein